MDKFWRGWKYKNITFVIVGLIVALYISRIEIFHEFLIHLGGAGFIGAFVAGILFVSMFTVATGALILFTLAEYLHPLEVAIISGLGAVIIASPFPDELGISLIGMSKMKTYKFVFISFLLNAIGIFLVVSASLAMKP